MDDQHRKKTCFDPSVNGEDMQQEWERGWKLFKHISQLVGDFRHSRSFPPLMNWCNWAVEAIHDPARRLVAVRPSGCCHRRSRYFNIKWSRQVGYVQHQNVPSTDTSNSSSIKLSITIIPMFRGHVACHLFHLHRVPAPYSTRPNGLRRRFHGLLVPTRTASDGQRGVESKLVHPGNLIFSVGWFSSRSPQKDISLWKFVKCSPFFLAVVAGLLLVLSFWGFQKPVPAAIQKSAMMFSQKTRRLKNKPHNRGWFILRVAGWVRCFKSFDHHTHTLKDDWMYWMQWLCWTFCGLSVSTYK